MIGAIALVSLVVLTAIALPLIQQEKGRSTETQGEMPLHQDSQVPIKTPEPIGQKPTNAGIGEK